MPTTRSQGRSEPLQYLETPPKRQRKPKKPRTPKKDAPETRYVSSSTQIINPSYCDASTQTDEALVLTVNEAVESQDRVVAPMAQKRTREDESEDEHDAKRHQFSTPQSKSTSLWMFGERTNGGHPRTAPSKSIHNQSLRRPMRGPLARRSNLTDSPRFRVKASAPSEHQAALENIKPIEQPAPESHTESLEERQQALAHEEADPAPIQSQQQPAAPQTPRRGLFGSLRGIVNKGWGLAASMTPLAAKTSPPAVQSASELEQINYPQLDQNTNDDESEMPDQLDAEYDEYDRVRPMQPISESAQPSSRYDHLHYIPADVASINRAISGELVPPHPPTPPSPASRLKAQNPGLSDATIDSFLKKRERKAALDEQRYGPAPVEEVPRVAPLFGPDSHWQRGTNDPRFLPPPPLFTASAKRKLDSVDGKIPRPKNGGYGIDDEYLDIDTEVDSVDVPVNMFEPPVKRPRIQETTTPAAPATPRSAMKKPGFSTANGRKSVAFGQSISRDIRGHYGPAGQYKGSTFADELPDDSRSPSSIDQSDVISPTTRFNTVANSGKKPASVLDNLGASIPAIDFTLRDPNDTKWRPSLGNPKPGVFRVPDVDEEDPDETMSDVTPEQPSTPRLSHAELPAAPNTIGSASFNESSIINESTELALDKARSRAEKYKPKSSSRLSEVSRARSRSTSPDAEEEEGHASIAQIMNRSSQKTAPAIQQAAIPRQPFVPPELDNTVTCSDGMTDHQREHQYDDWAANLDWDAPQTYEDSGTGSAFIHNLIRKNWTEEDDRRSEAFWAGEFEEVDHAMKKAQAQGHRLVLVTGMEEIEGY